MEEHDIHTEGHSEKLFTESRNFWYNPDFLELMAKRWQLSKYQSLLDVGAGLCHWNKLLLPFLKEGAKVTAMDNDPKWAEGNAELRSYYSRKKVDFDYLKADAHELPFADDSFEVVTCQTVLIHLHDPIKALTEMKRVVKPEGIVICAEPSNRAQLPLQDSVTRNDDIPATVDRVKMGLAQETIKKMDGDGDNSFGDLLTGTMNRIGYRHIQSYLNDKLVAIFPPYDLPEQRAAINQFLGWEDDGRLFDQEKNHLEELNETDFLAFLDAYQGRFTGDRMLAALKNQTYYNSGAAVMYLVSGKK